MERWTVADAFEGLFRMHINFGGSERYWCEFDFVVALDADCCGVEIEMAAGADADTLQWFPHVQRGMLQGVAKQREKGRQYVGIRITVCKIYAHEIDTTAKGCEIYGDMFIYDALSWRVVPLPAQS